MRDSSRGELPLQPDDKLRPDPSIGMEVAIKSENLANCSFYVIRYTKQIQILRRDQSLSQKMPAQELGPAFPIGSFFLIDQNDRDNPGLPGLHQRQALKPFVHRAETSWEESNSVGFLDEINFSREEIVEINEFRIALDNFIGLLLERQANIQAEAVLASRSPLGCAHDSISAAGDDHESALAHQGRE